mmetsp:Transcript_15067/g.32427  ORF Transcript_15067/g.32427 Transcript_15067/m.32427 type:complete len:126 (-) Transcript_15067:180-557(-)
MATRTLTMTMTTMDIALMLLLPKEVVGVVGVMVVASSHLKRPPGQGHGESACSELLQNDCYPGPLPAAALASAVFHAGVKEEVGEVLEDHEAQQRSLAISGSNEHGAASPTAGCLYTTSGKNNCD